MRLIKYTHACVRLEDGDRSLLIDPGVWTEPEAYDGVSDLLITHDHFDHLDVDRLRAVAAGRPGLTVHTHASVAAGLTEVAATVVSVAAGDVFTVNGFTVEAVGGAHAEIYDGLPGCANLGFVVGGV